MRGFALKNLPTYMTAKGRTFRGTAPFGLPICLHILSSLGSLAASRNALFSAWTRGIFSNSDRGKYTDRPSFDFIRRRANWNKTWAPRLKELAVFVVCR